MKTFPNFLILGTLAGMLAIAAPKMASAQTMPDSTLEYDNGPSGKLDIEQLHDIKSYAINAKTSISRTLSAIDHMSDSVEIKSKLTTEINKIISESKDMRSVLLLTHALESGMTLVKMIDQNSVLRGPMYTPQGTIDQENRILKRSLQFADDYYQSDFDFINGVETKREIVTNPKFLVFGVEITKFLVKMSDGVLNARSEYGMIRWTLAVLANYIKNDKDVGIAYSSTRYNIAKVLTQKDYNGQPVYPDLVLGEMAPEDIDCLSKIRELKLLAIQSLNEITEATKALKKK